MFFLLLHIKSQTVALMALVPTFYVDISQATAVIGRLTHAGTYAKGVNGVFLSLTYHSHTTPICGTQSFHMYLL